MRKTLLPVFSLTLSLTLLQLQARAEDAAAFKNEKEKASYAVGMFFARQMTNAVARGSMEVDNELVLAAFKDVVEGHGTRIPETQVQELLRAYQTESMHKLISANRQAGAAFLAENKTKEGIKTQTVTLPNGTNAEFQYKVLVDGTGPCPKSTDTVSVNYKGRLLNGTEFDSTARRGSPLHTPVGRLIRGWTEALQLMKVGSKWEIYIPADLAYGDNPAGPQVQPGSTLIFEMELLSIDSPAAAATHPQLHPANQPLTSDIIKVPGTEERKKGAQIEIIKPEDANKLIQTNK